MAVTEAELVRGPCAAVRAGRSGPQGGRKGWRPLAAAPWMAEKRGTGVRLLFRPFLLATQEKGARGPKAHETAFAPNSVQTDSTVLIEPPVLRARSARYL